MITQPEEYRQRLLDIQNSTDVTYMTITSEEPRFKVDLKFYIKSLYRRKPLCFRGVVGLYAEKRRAR